jgi:uncharacterized repeat protein (TIGR01451 family)
MKIHKLHITVSLLALAFTVSAQYVTIPDKNFASYLDTIIPSAMVGNQMDTSNISVKTLASINIENSQINNLSGIQYFTSLVRLDFGNGDTTVDSNKVVNIPTLPTTLDTLICGNNILDSLPLLPSGLVLLKCYGNRLTSLPALPPTLVELDCQRNQLDSLPALPGTLRYLSCYNNTLQNLPKLPAGLLQLFCYQNQLSSLPVLPLQLNSLYCGNNLLTQLPVLPVTLNSLSCCFNKLTSLMPLPNTLNFLDCSANLLTSMPSLPNSLIILMCAQNQLNNQLQLPAQLISLDCSADQLTSLPALPSTLTSLTCSSNPLVSITTLPQGLTSLYCEYDQLTSLPATLPYNLSNLFCDNNNLTCFPVFPQTLHDSLYFNILNNPFTCLPNYITAMNRQTLAYPLCGIGNTYGCPPANGIVGFTFKDMDTNCTKDSVDRQLTNIPVKLYGNANSLLNQTYTAVNGVYDFPDTAGSYTVVIDTTGMPFVMQCPHPGLDSVLTLSSIDTNINFSLTCKPGIDVGVQSVVTLDRVFPGMQHRLQVVAGDMSQWYNLGCAKGDSGTVQISISGPVTYAGITANALTPSSINGNVFTYNIADYGAIQNTSAFGLLLNTDSSAKAGNIICVTVTVTPTVDNNPGNNTYQYCYAVSNSHDPNIKSVYPSRIPENYDGWLVYTIHFQNTGTAPAHNISLTDTLDKNLDATTFQVINYSSQNTVHLIGHILTVSFPDINLPDSTSDPKGSIAFIQYRIKPKQGLPAKKIVKNTGYIYFDFNAAMATNTTNTLITAPEGVETITDPGSSGVYPNPNKGEFTIQSSVVSDKSLVEIYNIMGQKVASSNSSQGGTSVVITNTLPSGGQGWAVNLSNQPTGVYLYRITTENGKLLSSGKVIIE